jgi:uncharacterized cupin superfamily protein
MSTEPGVIRLQADGPADQGLKPLKLNPADFQSPLPVQNNHLYFSDPVEGLNAGVWETTTMQEAFGPYPGDEFIVVLEGRFEMVDGKGKGVPGRKGQSVIFRNGIPTSWKQDGYLKKFYVTLRKSDDPPPQIDSAEGGVIVLDPDMTLSDSDAVSRSNSGAKQRERVIFTNNTDKMGVGLCHTEAYTSEPFAFPSHEFVQVLDGGVSITTTDGTRQTFVAGDVFFIAKGTVTTWEVPTYLRKYYAAVDSAK